MSIERLNSIQTSFHETYKNKVDYESEKINKFMQETILIFKLQQEQINNLRQQIAEKIKTDGEKESYMPRSEIKIGLTDPD